MTDRTTTVSTVAAALVAAGAVLCAALPAEAVTPTPTPVSTASPSPSPSASSSSPATPLPVTPSPVASVPPAPTPRSATPPPAPVPSAPITAPPGQQPVQPSLAPAPTPTPAPTIAPPPLVPAPIATRLSVTSGNSARARAATLTGSLFTNLGGVTVGGQPVTDLVVVSSTLARFTIPAAADYQGKVAPIALTAFADGVSRPTALTFTYRVLDKVDRQMAYAFQNWNAYSNRTFGYLSGNDCANFASQTLLARGWTRGTEWFNWGVGRWSGTWVSSTALSTWLKKRPDLATWLPYRQRDQVVVGDIVQFRWPGHAKNYSSWDHTGIVSKVVVLPDGRHDVYYVAHTLNRQYGGSTQILARYMASDLRIQFFHLR